MVEPEGLKEPCSWCSPIMTGIGGFCRCEEPCGKVACPARDVDNYEIPPVPKFYKVKDD